MICFWVFKIGFKSKTTSPRIISKSFFAFSSALTFSMTCIVASVMKLGTKNVFCSFFHVGVLSKESFLTEVSSTYYPIVIRTEHNLGLLFLFRTKIVFTRKFIFSKGPITYHHSWLKNGGVIPSLKCIAPWLLIPLVLKNNLFWWFFMFYSTI